MKTADQLPDGSCRPVDLRVNTGRLQKTVDLFTEKLFSVGGGLYKMWNGNREKHGLAALNLTHHPDVKKLDRFFKHTGNRLSLAENELDESAFIEVPSEVAGTYLGELFKIVEEYHQETFGTAFVGRYQLIWVDPGSCYPLHVDEHTPHRYHIPVHTNERCLWLFEDNHKQKTLVHMPADGRVWYLDPVQQAHSVANFSLTPRLHLVMTSGS